MATLIPAISTCKPRMTSGERRAAERLEAKLDDDYLLWYDVPIGEKQARPDFAILHPRRGILVLEVKDWRLDTICAASRERFDILTQSGRKTVINPLEQARHYALQIVKLLERDRQLVQSTGEHAGKLAFPWGYGVLLPNVTRRQFDVAELNLAIAPDRVICQDEMVESIDPEALQSRLWQMLPHHFGRVLSLPQIDRVRWNMFPEIRTPDQANLFTEADAEVPDVVRVMDLQQEQLARSLGTGHRVIHGVAGSGKTMILGYRAEQLAKVSGPGAKPILILCYNEPLAVQLQATIRAKCLANVQVRHFHRWCRQQLVAYGQEIPSGERMFDAMVDGVIRAVDRRQVPSGQYQAVLIDEGHDFRPEWLKLVAQMVDPETNSLLVLYDDAQSIFLRSRSRQFSFKSVGIQATGRTTILKINYRNTRQILQFANLVASDLLTAEDKDDDGIPLIKPIACGREGTPPIVVRLPNLREEAVRIADLLQSAHQEGYAWSEMALLCRDYAMIDVCAAMLKRRQLPHEVRKKAGDFHPETNTIKLMTMKVSKGLEFPVVALHGAGHGIAANSDEREDARIFYVAATRATERLIVSLSGDGGVSRKLLAAGI